MIGRIVIAGVRPSTPSGHPAKAVVGEVVPVTADIFRDGHDILAARVRWRATDKDGEWSEAPLHHLGNDRWEGALEASALGHHELVIEAWTDTYATWRHKVTAKLGAGQDLSAEFAEAAAFLGARSRKVAKEDRPALAAARAALLDESLSAWDRLRDTLDSDVGNLLEGPGSSKELTRTKSYPLWVDRERALYGAWYELFPRSEAGLRTTADKRLPAVAEMGFDIVYLPPIHPIGTTKRKGRGNSLTPAPDDPGSPWAIGSAEGGHTSIHSELGTEADFAHLVEKARSLGMEIALDYALQCSPDHPWVSEHPEWFHRRADGSIAFAENPPKKYEDIYPINFWPAKEADRVALWNACRDIFLHWIERGVRVFRVDNPHTKPLAFWEWIIPEVRDQFPETLFLAEAFTRPKMMAALAAVGFTQGYTYFTWRTARWELEEYLTELSTGPVADYMRPNFWPNTPDILSGPLRGGGRAAFKIRFILAATLTPSYGVYSGYELFENDPASDTNEEYADSEKYTIKTRDWDSPASLAPWMTEINRFRREHPALHRLRNIEFIRSNNDQILAFSKLSDDGTDAVVVVVNLDPHSTHEATLQLDLTTLGLAADQPFNVTDAFSGLTFTWGPNPYVRLDPAEPAHLLHVQPVRTGSVRA